MSDRSRALEVQRAQESGDRGVTFMVLVLALVLPGELSEDKLAGITAELSRLPSG